jgi:hypothetical protein
MRGLVFLFAFTFILSIRLVGQPVPAEVENIPYLVTFGPKAEKAWGDDDHSQTFFFLIPENFKEPIYIRIWDPEIGGQNDELNGVWDTQMTYAVYGGKGAYSDPDARETDPKGNYKSGNLLASKTFVVNAKYDNGYYTFGPFNPTEGEYTKDFAGYIFKIICDGQTGDDGNMYRFFLSTSGKENKPVEGANAFAYEYCFRLWDNAKEVSHIYPYIDDRTTSVLISNFDWDNDGFIRVVSVARMGQNITDISNQDEWKTTELKIKAEEKNTSFDLQFHKKNPPVKNNNVVVNVRNQYGELMRFFTVPIGGVPKFKMSIQGKKVTK